MLEALSVVEAMTGEVSTPAARRLDEKWADRVDLEKLARELASCWSR